MSGLVRSLAIVSVMILPVACASSSTPDNAAIAATAVNPLQEWEPTTCSSELPDTAGWPRHRLFGVSIAVPPEYRRRSTRAQGQALLVARGTSELNIYFPRNVNRERLAVWDPAPGSVRCIGNFGGHPGNVVAWHLRVGNGFTTYHAQITWQGLEPATVSAYIKADRLTDAVALRSALHTIVVESQGPR